MGSPTVYINGIECSYVMPDGRVAQDEGADESGPKVTRYYKCAYGDRWDLVEALMATCEADGSSQGFTRYEPYSLPENSALVCTSTGKFGYVGSGVDESGNPYPPFAVVPANFSCVPWQFEDGDPGGQNDASGQAWTVTKIKPSCEVYQPQGGTYYVGPFNGNAVPLNESGVGFPRANCEISRTRKFLPWMPLNDYLAGGAGSSGTSPNPALGAINLRPIPFGDTIYGIGKLLLVGIEASEPYFDCLGNCVMDVNETFLGRLAADWNRVQDADGAWQLVNTKADGTGSAPFKLYDFIKLPR